MIKMKRVSLKKLQKVWEDFENSGIDYSPFLNYNLASTINKYYFEFKLAKREFPRFYAFYENGKIIAIAPVCRRYTKNVIKWVSFGSAPTLAAWDFIYSKELSHEKLIECLKILLDKIKKIRIDNLVPSSKVYKFILEHSDFIKEKKNVKILLPNTYEEYFNSLSKNARQNIRTAYNRMKTDNCTFSYKIYINEPVPKKEYEKVLNLYVNRRNNKYGKLSFIRQFFLKKRHFNSIGLQKLSNSVQALLYINGELAGYWGGYMYKSNTSILIPRLAINSKYLRYSPGLILINETIKYFKSNLLQIKVFDLSKGAEQYKFVMGGEEYLHYDFIISNNNKK